MDARSTTGRGELVLVVDDDADIREALCSILEAEGYRAMPAVDGRHALALAAEEPPALILLDLMMPVMSGGEFRVAQLAEARLRDVPVLLLSADARSHETGRLLGVDATLGKPFTLDALLAAMRRVLAAREEAARAATPAA